MIQVESVEGFNVKNIEGMTNSDNEPDPEPVNDNEPDPISTDSTSGSVSQDTCLDDFNKLKRDNYTLKTKVVTPVYPYNPYDRIVSDWKKEHDDLHKKEKEKEIKREEERHHESHHERLIELERQLEKERDNMRNRQDISSNSLANLLPNSNRDLSSNRVSSSNSSVSDTQRKPDVSTPTPSPPPNFFNSNTMMNNNSLLSTPEKKVEPEPAKAEDKKSTPEDLSKCPPCPACERCPEPTVDCKKIIKYKSNSYPVPVIADFSNFSRFG